MDKKLNESITALKEQVSNLTFTTINSTGGNQYVLYRAGRIVGIFTDADFLMELFEMINLVNTTEEA